MKLFILLLLASNLVFLLVQWLLPYSAQTDRVTNIPVAEKLRLINEPELQAETDLAQTGEEESKGSPDPVIPKVDQQLCYTLGPYKQQEVALQVSAEFKAHQIAISTRPSVEREYMGMMVYIDGHETRQQAINTAETLASLGVKDYLIVNEPGKQNALSLGVFGLKKNAERRQSRIASLGYPVKSEPRYRSRTIYWLDYETREPEKLKTWLQGINEKNAVSTITRPCKA